MAIYSDLNFDIELNEDGDLNIKEDLDAIKQSITNIILTRPGEYVKYQNPYFGCGVMDLIGEKITSATVLLIQNEITLALENFEPRIRVLTVGVEEKIEYTLSILIKYNVVSIDFTDELVIDVDIIK